jgi:hypothetical protein
LADKTPFVLEGKLECLDYKKNLKHHLQEQNANEMAWTPP